VLVDFLETSASNAARALGPLEAFGKLDLRTFARTPTPSDRAAADVRGGIVTWRVMQSGACHQVDEAGSGGSRDHRRSG